jgi:hypothetical protein
MRDTHIAGNGRGGVVADGPVYLAHDEMREIHGKDGRCGAFEDAPLQYQRAEIHTHLATPSLL